MLNSKNSGPKINHRRNDLDQILAPWKSHDRYIFTSLFCVSSQVPLLIYVLGHKRYVRANCKFQK